MLGKLFRKKDSAPYQQPFSKEELDAIKADVYKDGKKTGYTEGWTTGMAEGENLGFERGKRFMKDRYVAFMKETQLMVENDEMELIEVIGVEDANT